MVRHALIRPARTGRAALAVVASAALTAALGPLAPSAAAVGAPHVYKIGNYGTPAVTRAPGAAALSGDLLWTAGSAPAPSRRTT
ncbi:MULTISPECIES: hypothetical protein [unclassified Streptomyces]|uniref:hypothetical protein n=1 Tax=unclassified Streptomyces TaxID=2593676 RepID=UPI003327C831